MFAHGHVLRVLAARWLGLAPDEGRLFALDPASLSVLGHEHEWRVLRSWNERAYLRDVAGKSAVARVATTVAP